MQNYANLVAPEKFCETHTYLKTSASIPPRTSPPKIGKFCKILPRNNFAKKMEQQQVAAKASQETLELFDESFAATVALAALALYA